MSIMVTVEGSPDGEYDEHGYQAPAWPWVNLANANAIDVFRMLGLEAGPGDGGLYGSVEVEDLPQAIRACVRAINSVEARVKALRSGTDEKRPGRCRVITMELDHDYLIDRAERMQKVFRKAQLEGARVVWG